MVLHLEMDTVAAPCHPQVRHLGEEVADVVRRRGESPGEIAVANGPRVGEVEARGVPRDEHGDDSVWGVLGVEKGDADDLVGGVAGGQRLELRLRGGEIQGEGIRRGHGAGARALADAEQEHDLVLDPGGGRVEDGDDLEAGERRGHVGRGEDGVLGQAVVPAVSRVVRRLRTPALAAERWGRPVTTSRKARADRGQVASCA